METVEKLLLVSPRGFCAGVARAVKAVDDTLALFGAPIYVKHEIVHNKHIVEDFSSKGVVTIETLAEVPEGAVVVFSAHGSVPEHYIEAKKRGLTLIDATCPLVTKVHLEVHRFLKDGYTIVYIGHKGHIEGLGVLGEAKAGQIPLVESISDVENLSIGNPEKMVYLTQTTLSIDDTAGMIRALQKKYPQITQPPLSDICFATTNRQIAVKSLAKVTELVLIIGSKNSSNSTRLMETARQIGTEAHLIDDISEINQEWLVGKKIVGLSAGASAPENLVDGVVQYFKSKGVTVEEYVVGSETMHFAEPLELMKLRKKE
ncbi:MAG: 4-hydroxy-3-methylbut-2-enyl diphosphate reductase [Candidatus Moranbacteria bacterium]|nr:4-hydroxy-3-methylbut-2-enyl diphosphate reductase [Candidatus Moranbacteria bacterium]OIQ03508.1 MAG: 4-hydroxy-3-methylbut-2-enyl diphosphate reductase [Candidatus Moranbacteria bacterium CG2_30_41_165]PIP25291.1 MAG: 4-hydroxy-3-methylbut-2-enyl diphosphate reductase [Candidatus Moranbacteria bacterium CG23_combo_of_CG06-09_8_20_14_all_41_28]PIV86575.1 MAG: 4-hydroxy-3-methylbut-2-enyl diphosphate reductase [Candidatus Moranbacteria bacterium CG17_big_fil_post_rev_8_21_14_2_50_41_107]PIW9